MTQFGAPRAIRLSVPHSGHSAVTRRSGDFSVLSFRRIGSMSTRKRRLPQPQRISSTPLPRRPGLSLAITRLILGDIAGNKISQPLTSFVTKHNAIRRQEHLIHSCRSSLRTELAVFLIVKRPHFSRRNSPDKRAVGPALKSFHCGCVRMPTSDDAIRNNPECVVAPTGLVMPFCSPGLFHSQNLSL